LADSKQTTKKSSATRRSSQVWTEEEKAAMRESARERKATARLSPEEQRAEGEREVRDKIAELTGSDREIAEGIHALVIKAAPSLAPRTYYGMPAYAKDGKVICFFQPASKFKVRYATLGFQPDANLDEGSMWATSFALTELTSAHEERIVALVKKAVS
jgi:uncharacterized protein YdhG (YjbR/CyaY superfamily)